MVAVHYMFVAVVAFVAIEVVATAGVAVVLVLVAMLPPSCVQSLLLLLVSYSCTVIPEKIEKWEPWKYEVNIIYSIL